MGTMALIAFGSIAACALLFVGATLLRAGFIHLFTNEHDLRREIDL